MDPAAKNIPPQKLDLQNAHSLIADDLQAVEHLILQQTQSTEKLIRSITDYILNAGGKRIRPMLVLLVTGCCGFRNQVRITLAAAIECLHTATLLHDDVIDASDLRRGNITVNHRWNNTTSILMGDYFHTQVLQLLVQINNLEVTKVIATASKRLVEGEIMQLECNKNMDVTEQDYTKIIQNKTAVLFQAATHAAAVLAGVPKETATILRDFGMHFGLNYQLIDDALDYSGYTDTLGKNTGDDLVEGKITLPLIHLLAQSTDQAIAKIKQAISCQDKTELNNIVQAVKACGGVEYTQQAAKSELHKAAACLGQLPKNSYQKALVALLDYALYRQS